MFVRLARLFSHPKCLSILGLTFFAIALPGRLYAQSDNKDESFLGNVGGDLTSPVSKNAYPYTVIGAAATLTIVLSRDLIRSTQSEFTNDKPLGKFNESIDLMGQLVPNAAYMLGMFAHGKVSENKESIRRSSVMLRASLYSAGATTVLKHTIRESRPNNPNRKDAFPSGHTTTVFAFASVVAFEHGWTWGTPALLMATLVGVERVNDNMHRLQDVVAGAAVGIAYGAGIYYRSQQKETSVVDSHVHTDWLVLPSEDFHGAQFNVTLSF